MPRALHWLMKALSTGACVTSASVVVGRPAAPPGPGPPDACPAVPRTYQGKAGGYSWPPWSANPDSSLAAIMNAPAPRNHSGMLSVPLRIQAPAGKGPLPPDHGIRTVTGTETGGTRKIRHRGPSARARPGDRTAATSRPGLLRQDRRSSPGGHCMLPRVTFPVCARQALTGAPGPPPGRCRRPALPDSGRLPGCRPALTRVLIALAGLYQDERWLLCYVKEILARAAADIASIRIRDHPRAGVGNLPRR